MKKILLLSVLLVPLCAFADRIQSTEGFYEPEWKNFVPPAYVDVTAPKGLGKFNDTAAYWYKRRVEFDTEIQKCREIEGNDLKVACYQKLKAKQYQKNSDYNARLEAMDKQKMMPTDFQNPTGNMLPLDGFANMMKFQPNEFR